MLSFSSVVFITIRALSFGYEFKCIRVVVMDICILLFDYDTFVIVSNMSASLRFMKRHLISSRKYWINVLGLPLKSGGPSTYTKAIVAAPDVWALYVNLTL